MFSATGMVVAIGNTTQIQVTDRRALDEQFGPGSQMMIVITNAAPQVLAQMTPGQNVDVDLALGKTADEQAPDGAASPPNQRQVLGRRGPAGAGRLPFTTPGTPVAGAQGGPVFEPERPVGMAR